MMDAQLYTLRGYYNPTFLQMKVDAPCDLSNLNNIKRQHFSTFFHEYIHYLQDVTTTFGIINANIICNRLKHFVKEIEISTNPTFEVPLLIPAEHITSINRELQQIYMGNVSLGDSLEPSQVTINKIDLIDVSAILQSKNDDKVYEVVVNVGVKSSNYDFKFGAICLMETMANLIQMKHFPEVKAPAFPYYSGVLIANNIYQTIGDNPEFVFALCDACLMEYNPGHAFVSMLMLMSENKFVPEKSEEIYNFVFENIKGRIGESLMEIFLNASEEVEKLYGDFFESSAFIEERKWSSAVISEARRLRTSVPNFMVELYRETSPFGRKIVEVADIMGTPLMFNRNELGFFQEPKKVRGISIDPSRLAAILEMFKLFEDGKKSCGLKSFCEQNISTDQRCIEEPWSRCKDLQLCAYAQFWKTWKLSDKAPV